MAKRTHPAPRRRSGSRSTQLSPNCRCQCAVVGLITGPEDIKAGSGTKTYGLTVQSTRNGGCRQSTSGCAQGDTTWTTGGQLGGAVTLSDQKKDSVKVAVAAGTGAGTFTLLAQPSYTCKCISNPGPDPVVQCTTQQNSATITVVP